MLGGKKNKYTYQPIVRTTLGENGEPNPDKHPYIKLKLLTEYPGNAIKTVAVEQCDDGARFLKTDTKLNRLRKTLPFTREFKVYDSTR